jgi:sorbitol/mannitol transport system permease protein
MTESRFSKWAFGILAWLVAIIIFFPIFVMAITAFKNEREAQTLSLFFLPTLESFYEVFARSNYLNFVLNSIFASVGSTLLCFALAIPAAYRMAFYPTKKTQSTLVWMLSTKMMPAVGVLIPLYILCQFFGLLDNIIALIVIYALINLPIAVWMAYTYFCEVPGAILEAARIDGATIWGEMWHVLRPMTLPFTPRIAGLRWCSRTTRSIRT